MNEKGFKNKVTTLLKEQGFFVYCSSDNSRGGVPDVFCSRGGMGYWLELKYTKKTAEECGDKVSLSHPLSAQQSKFLRDAGMKGGVLIGFGCGGMMLVPVDDIEPGPSSSFKVCDVITELNLG